MLVSSRRIWQELRNRFRKAPAKIHSDMKTLSIALAASRKQNISWYWFLKLAGTRRPGAAFILHIHLYHTQSNFWRSPCLFTLACWSIFLIVRHSPDHHRRLMVGCLMTLLTATGRDKGNLYGYQFWWYIDKYWYTLVFIVWISNITWQSWNYMRLDEISKTELTLVFHIQLS